MTVVKTLMRWAVVLAILGMIAALLLGRVDVAEFTAIVVVFFAFFFLLLFDPETILEMSAFGTSVKRVETAKRDVEKIRQDMRDIAKTMAEVVHGVQAGSITYGRTDAMNARLIELMDELEKFAEPDDGKRVEWAKNVDDIFHPSGRKRGMTTLAAGPGLKMRKGGEE